MAHSATLIFNPVSGSGNSDEDLRTIKHCLGSKIALEVLSTTEEQSARDLAEIAINRGVKCVIVSGGDGTVSQVAGALIGTEIPLGIIARGTANAFANALNIPTTIEQACEAIVQGLEHDIIQVIDVGRCRDETMLLLTGIGFEADTVEDADREAKDRWGMLAYFFSGLKQLRNLKSFTAELETEDKIIKVEAAAITVANTAPASSILAQGPAGIIANDGLLDITIVAPQDRIGAIAASYHLLQSAFHEDGAQRDDIGYLRTRWIKITADPPQKVVLDGEIIGETPIEIECIPRQLRLIVPGQVSHEQTEKLNHLPGVKICPKTDPGESDGGSSEKSSDSVQTKPDVIIIDYRIPD